MSPESKRNASFSFIQMADVQFGLFAALSGADNERIESAASRRLIIRPVPSTTGFAKETDLYTRAISEANQLRPEFVVMCGDMVQDSSDCAQLAELSRITAKLRDDIPIKWVAGNHDVGNSLTRDSLTQYRERFGKDDYFFDVHGSRFIVLNSNIAFDSSEVPGEWERQQEFLAHTLSQGNDSRENHIVVFTHHPLFLDYPEEDDSHLVVPRERRRIILRMLKAANASAVFSGHWHRNNYARDGKLQMVTTAAVGYPMGYDPSGYRVVHVKPGDIEHKYVGIDEVPV